MPPVGDDPVARRRRAAAAATSSAAFATSARAPSSPRWRRRTRISLKKWNRRRRPGGGPSRSRCRPLARLASQSDKEERQRGTRPLNRWSFNAALLAMTPWLAGAAARSTSSAAAFATIARAPSSPRWRRRQQPQRRPGGPSRSLRDRRSDPAAPNRISLMRRRPGAPAGRAVDLARAS